MKNENSVQKILLCRFFSLFIFIILPFYCDALAFPSFTSFVNIRSSVVRNNANNAVEVIRGVRTELFQSSSSSPPPSSSSITASTSTRSSSRRSRSRSERSNDRSTRKRERGISSLSSTRTRRQKMMRKEGDEEVEFNPIKLTSQQIENRNASLFEPLDYHHQHHNNGANQSPHSDDYDIIKGQALSTDTTTHFITLSLDDLFQDLYPNNMNLSHAFNTDPKFRQELREAIRKDMFFANEQNRNLPEKAQSILLGDDSSLQGSFAAVHNKQANRMDTVAVDMVGLNNMTRLTQVLQQYFHNDNDELFLTGTEFMKRFAALCNPSFFESQPSSSSLSQAKDEKQVSYYHWIDIIGIQNRKINHSWHQDTAEKTTTNNKRNVYTCMLGFPPTDNYEGTGVFSHIVKLKNERYKKKIKEQNNDNDRISQEPVLYTHQHINDNDSNNNNCIPEEYVVRPKYKAGETEIIIYRDIDVLHSAPDVAYRQSVMRFMCILPGE